MANPDLIKTYDASGAIAAYTIVKFTSTDFQVAKAAAATDALAGVATEVGASDGQRVDVIHGGIAAVVAGGTIAAGDPITADSNGKGVKAAPADGAQANIIGYARQSAASGDVFDVIISFGTITGVA